MRSKLQEGKNIEIVDATQKEISLEELEENYDTALIKVLTLKNKNNIHKD